MQRIFLILITTSALYNNNNNNCILSKLSEMFVVDS